MLFLRPPSLPLRSLLPSLTNPRSNPLHILSAAAAAAAADMSSSSGKNVNDFLMGKARAAAAKKKSPTKPSLPPKKPKILETLKTLETPKEDEEQVKEPQTLETLEAKKPKTPATPKDISMELKKKGPDFNPLRAATWEPGNPVPFLFLARTLDLISNESGRIAITDILSNAFLTIIATTPSDLLPAVYLSANRIAPPHEGVELGIGDASLIKALASAYAMLEENVKKQLKVLLN